MSINGILQLVVFTLLLVAVAIRGGATFSWIQTKDEVPNYTITDIKMIYPDAESLASNRDKSISVKDNDGKVIAEFICSSDFDVSHFGYSGEVPLIIELANRTTVLGVHLLRNNETADYIQLIKNKNLLQAWNGYTLNDTIVSLSVDAISGATMSSDAIINNTMDTLSAFGSVKHKSLASLRFANLARILLGMLLIALSLIMYFRAKLKKYYLYYSALVLLVMGVWLKQMLSMGLLHNWLVSGTSLNNNITLIMILILSIGMTLLGYRRYYCNYLCPMGALQLLVSKVSPFKKRSLNFKISNITLKTIYLYFILISLLLGFALPLFEMEPFYAFSFSVASTIMLLSGVLIIILSLFFNRPWCKLCPTGCLIDSIPSIYKKENHEASHERRTLTKENDFNGEIHATTKKQL